MKSAVTIEMIDEGLARCLHFIETTPGGDKLWPIFDRLEMERELLLKKSSRIDEARERLKARQQDRTAGQS